VTGVARGEMSVRGTFDDPVVDGDLTLDDGSFHAVSLGVTFSEIGGRLALEGNRLTVDSLTAVSGGTINVTGGIDLTTLREPTFDMHVEARDARVLDNDEGKLTVDADLDVKGPFDDVAVTGQVTTRRGVIYIPELQDLGETSVVALDEPATFERVDTLLAARRDLLLERHPLLSAIHVDIGVTVNRDVWLRSLETNVEIYTPPELGPMRVQLDGEQRALILEGIINTDRGEYEFMTRPFQLTRGSVTFLGDRELDAVLQVAAEHEVRIPGRQAFAIRVLLGGTLRAPTITMESTAQPPISQTELLTYVALGPHAGAVLPVQGSALSSQGDPNGDFVGNAAALATQQIASAAVGTVLNDIEGEAARSLGVDVLRITPADLPNELFQGKVGDVLLGTEIEIGSYVTPRLFASAQTLATFVRPGARLEYLSPNGFRWITTWQPRYLPSEPTLAEQDPLSKSVFGLLLRREWRF
jgi:translocation and assembly module TamB